MIDTIEQRKLESTLQLLFRAARLVNEEALRRAQSKSGKVVRAAHTMLFPHIDWCGTRQVELARRLGISKQAVGQLVDELEEMGMLERVADPEDGRAKLVRFTEAGKQGILHGLSVLRELECELASDPAAWAAFRAGLLGILKRLDAGTAI
jgi:DNA-binding MarR family transcriptional regulator